MRIINLCMLALLGATLISNAQAQFSTNIQEIRQHEELSFEDLLQKIQFGKSETYHFETLPGLNQVFPQGGNEDRHFSLTIHKIPSIQIRLRFIGGLLRQYRIYSDNGSSYSDYENIHDRVLAYTSSRYPGRSEASSKRHTIKPSTNARFDATLEAYKFAYDKWSSEDGIVIHLDATPRNFIGLISDGGYFKEKAANAEAAKIAESEASIERMYAGISQKYKKYLNSYLSKNSSALILDWGAPNRQLKMPNGDTAYTWEVEFEKNSSCVTTFIIHKNKVKNWSFKGNACFEPRQ